MLGIIGGMGPIAGADFARQLVEGFHVDDEMEIPDFCLISVAVPSRQKAILDDGLDPVPSILKAIESAQYAGAKAAVISCYTAHYYFERLRAASNIPLINLPAVTLRKAQAQTILVLETFGASKAKVAQAACNSLVETSPSHTSKHVYRLSEQDAKFVDDYIKRYKLQATGEKENVQLKRIMIEAIEREGGELEIVPFCTEIQAALCEDYFQDIHHKVVNPIPEIWKEYLQLTTS